MVVNNKWARGVFQPDTATVHSSMGLRKGRVSCQSVLLSGLWIEFRLPGKEAPQSLLERVTDAYPLSDPVAEDLWYEDSGRSSSLWNLNYWSKRLGAHIIGK